MLHRSRRPPGPVTARARDRVSGRRRALASLAELANLMSFPLVPTVAALVLGSAPHTHAAPAADPSPTLAPSTLDPDLLADDQALIDLVWTRSPEVLLARGQASAAQAEVVRAGLYPNPELSLDASSLPLGGAPAEIDSPWRDGPALGVGLGWTLELGKRAPRQRLAKAGFDTALGQARVVAEDRFFELLSVLSRLAMAELRADAMSGLIAQSQALLDLQEKRAQAGDIAQTEVAKAELEHARLAAQQGTALSEREEARGRCAQLVGLACPAFTPPAARAWVDRALAYTLPSTLTPELQAAHPELQALDAEARQARALADVASSAAIPDLGLRAGYAYNSLPGNIAHTASLGVSIPLTFASRGQAEAAQSQAELQRIGAQRDARIATAARAIETAQRRLDLARQRTRGIDQTLERARALTETLTTALQRGAGNLADLLIARRAIQEIQLDRLATLELAIDAVLDARREAGLAPRPRTP